MNIFVPGRICIFGEHTDWVGFYRRINAYLEKGFTIITGTNQGLYAEIKPHPNKLIFKSSPDKNGLREIFEIQMDKNKLLSIAEKGGYFSYIAGVTYQILTHYHVQGIEIDNYLTDLPIKKGLSSSAAISVLIARAFNKIYNLKMTIRGEMEYAYLGEITTPSRCGRMDQGCAYGNKPILMIFDGDKITVKEIKVDKELFFVIVDLKAEKNTKEILNKLNQCYPFAENETQKKVHDYFGKISVNNTNMAVKAFEIGNAKEIGELMSKSQADFDKYIGPVCPEQLTAPILHKVLNYNKIQDYIYGGKGVGSQGDGSAQFIVRDEYSQNKVIEILEKDLNLSCLKLSIKPEQKIRKAVIPAAGFGTRLFPASKAMKKEMLPIIDRDGRIKPAIQIIIEEAINSGIEDICIIIQKDGREIFENYFKKPLNISNFNKLTKNDKDYCDYLIELGNKIHFIEQEKQDGFGHAIYCAKEWINNEIFLLLLGDHIYYSSNGKPCVKQLIEVYEKMGNSVVSVIKTPIDKIYNFGCIGGNWIDESVLSITEFIEKPDIKYAREYLIIEGFEENNFLSLFGQYIISPKIFDFLEENISHDFREYGEFQLTNCLEKLRLQEGFYAFMVDGKRYDIGLPEEYKNTLNNFS